MDKAKKRFEQKAEEMVITFVPQCNTCRFNIDYSNCKVFGEKPKEYTSNKEDCPKRLKVRNAGRK